MGHRMQRSQLNDMSRQLEAQLNRVNQLVQSTLQPYMEANAWSVMPPFALQAVYDDADPFETMARMNARPQQLRDWAKLFLTERNRLVQMSNRLPPQTVQSEGLGPRLYQLVTKLETLSAAYRQLSFRLQVNLMNMNQPQIAPPAQQHEVIPEEWWENIPGEAEEDNLSDEEEDWNITQSRRRGGM